jgi:anti-sigma factor RsiW
MKDRGERPPGKSCRAIVEVLCDYIEGELPPEEERELDSHMADCPPCLSFLKTYRKTTEICRSLSPEEIPAELKERLKRFLERRQER